MLDPVSVDRKRSTYSSLDMRHLEPIALSIRNCKDNWHSQPAMTEEEANSIENQRNWAMAVDDNQYTL